jgi:predicted nucleic acid-binding protein
MAVQKIATTTISTLVKEQAFIVDTNILYFIHSGYYSTFDPKKKAYSDFIQKLITNGNKLIISVANLQELLHCIENKEYQLCCNKNNLNKKNPDNTVSNPFSKKDFRANSSLRKSVQKKLQAVLVEIKSSYNLSDCAIVKEQIEDFLKQYDNHRYDPIDFVVVNNMAEDSHVNFITDDSDFTYDSNIHVFTL